jgi:hypothetical protein
VAGSLAAQTPKLRQGGLDALGLGARSRTKTQPCGSFPGLSLHTVLEGPRIAESLIAPLGPGAGNGLIQRTAARQRILS